MPTTTTPAAQAVASNAFARRQQAAAEARAASADLFPVDTTTPLVGKAPLEALPEPPTAPAPARPVIVLSTTVAYRGRIITISNDGMTLDQFCDLLDKKFGVAE
jgi:hypothetical protein